MPAKKKHTPKRSSGQSTLTISLPADLRKKILAAAKNDNRSTSNSLVTELSKLLPILAFLILSALALLHWQRSPGNWSVKAIKQTVAAVVAKIEAKTK